MPQLKRSWVLVAIGVVIVASFVFNDSLRTAFSRQRKVAAAQAELNVLSRQLSALRQKISHIKSNPEAHEHLVRRELGYVRPGEKEIRFVKEEK